MQDLSSQCVSHLCSPSFETWPKIRSDFQCGGNFMHLFPLLVTTDATVVLLFFIFLSGTLLGERKLLDMECPLLVQLNWGNDDREGRFLLKKETDKTRLVCVMYITV